MWILDMDIPNAFKYVHMICIHIKYIFILSAKYKVNWHDAMEKVPRAKRISIARSVVCGAAECRSVVWDSGGVGDATQELS